MSDRPLGEGWWEASDGRWYAPELHPDHRPPASPPAQTPYTRPSVQDPGNQAPHIQPPGPYSGFEPPVHGDRMDSMPPPGNVGQPGPPPSGPAQIYPAVAPKKGSTGKILAIIFGGLFLVLAGGCGVFLWAFRDQIADGTVDFSDAVTADDPATCEVTGLDFAQDYEVEATLTATSAAVESHYQLQIELAGGQGNILGIEQTVLRNMVPGDQRTESVFNTIATLEPVESVTCTVTRILRVDAG